MVSVSAETWPQSCVPWSDGENILTLRIHYHASSREELDVRASIWAWRDSEDEGKELSFEQSHTSGFLYEAIISSRDTHINFLLKSPDFTQTSPDYRVKLRQDIPVTDVWLVEGDETLYYSPRAARTSPNYTAPHADPHAFDMVRNAKSFDETYAFDGWLGVRTDARQNSDRNAHATAHFRLWAPTALDVDLLLFESAEDGAPLERIVPMRRAGEIGSKGVWEASAQIRKNQAYAYSLQHTDGARVRTVDPYAHACTADGMRGVVVANASPAPSPAPWRLDNPNRAVICELHVRDFTISHTSGVPRALRGTYLGACERGTVNSFGDATGLDYLVQQGLTHVQLMPVARRVHHHLSKNTVQYNWGYDPLHYMMPENIYAADPSDPLAPLRELKHLIAQFHEAGLGVVLDVVFNHTFSSATHPFQLTVPDYFYRLDPVTGEPCDGSGCGNEVASERAMVRRYIVDTVLYWAREYGVDGFRFDLMGLLDVETMREVRRALDDLDPRILVYGEGWDMGTALAPADRAMKANAGLVPRVGFFNDDVRDAVKGGEVFGELKRGFVSGAPTEGVLAKCVLGSDELSGYSTPSQVVNYIDAHDNYTLRDLLTAVDGSDSPEKRELANALNLVMQGVCFMHLGQEFGRTKVVGSGEQVQRVAMNSYNAPDSVNRINWDLVSENEHSVDLVRQLIQMKTAGEFFSFESFEDIRAHVYVWSALDGTGILGFDVTNTQRDTTYRIVATTVDVPEENVLKDMPDARVIFTNNSWDAQKNECIPPCSLVIFEEMHENSF
ncbi:type I pullulanase [Alloscardovia macacae]|uniref:1,4-alpha-D-glucan glucanohydrolase n=1 Tax=Alloscardovia macacae TaxID=1160091 RepID=A0A261F559_9BIFI|nr:type I pullulanase [Alloscardovia macacae]OZG54252.1 glycogen debranching protein [Alloscardovia macacae]